MRKLLSKVRRNFVGNEADLAREWQARVVQRMGQEREAEGRRFAEVMGCDPAPEHVIVARGRHPDGRLFWAGLPPEELLGMHGWVTGATGSGKTFFVLGCLLQLLRANRHPIVIVDMKGELTTLLIEMAVPALTRLITDEGFMERLRIIRPFDRRYLPLLRITEPEAGVPREVQAYNLASALEEALADDLGSRMSRVYLRLCSLAIERNAPLTIIQRWLEHPEAFTRDAERSADPAVRRYARGAFRRETRSSIDALLARLDTFLFLRETRLVLSAPSCLPFSECLENGLTIIDVGDPPAGAERVARFWAGILIGKLTRAIFSRSVEQGSSQALVILEEFQEALRHDQVEQFGRLLAMARFKRIALWFVNQQPAQIAQVEPALVKLLRTNVGTVSTFRCALEDAKAMSHALHIAPGTKKPAEARQALVEEMTRLPDRTFYFWLRQAPFRAQQVRSPRIDLGHLRELAAQLPAEVHEAIRRGTVALPREELETLVEQEQVDCPEPITEIPSFLIPGGEEGDEGFPTLG